LGVDIPGLKARVKLTGMIIETRFRTRNKDPVQKDSNEAFQWDRHSMQTDLPVRRSPVS